MILDLANILVTLMGLTPLYAYLIYRLNLNGVKKYYMVQALSVVGAFMLLLINKVGKYPSWILIFYVTAFIIIHGFSYRRFGHSNYSLILSSSLLVIFVSSEFWELPIFIQAWLGFNNHEVTYMFQPAYTVASFILLLKISKCSVSKRLILIPLTCFLLNIMLLPPFSLLSGLGYIVARLVTCLSLSSFLFSSSTVVKR